MVFDEFLKHFTLQVEDYVTKIVTCVLDEGGKSRQLKNIVGPIIEEFVNDEDLSKSRAKMQGF